MLLVDAIYINNGGGKVLLDYLIDSFEKTGLEVFYLLDERIKNQPYAIKESNRVSYMSSSFMQRIKFYRNNRDKFQKIFILGNIPPPIKTNATVYTYFHNSIYIDVPNDFSWVEKIKYKLKVAIIKYTSKNTNFWFVQSKTMEDQFVEKFSQKEKISIVPFYPEYSINKSFERECVRFLYVSNAQSNKNHIRLIDAFCNAYDKAKVGRLVVTVNQDYPHILQRIEQAQKENYPIDNIGFVDKNDLIEQYQKAQYIIFPSLAESFGLGIIEGISMGCKVIGADLPYTYAVCTPSLVFNPLMINSIEEAILKALEIELPFSSSKTKNEIDKLVKLLS